MRRERVVTVGLLAGIALFFAMRLAAQPPAPAAVELARWATLPKSVQAHLREPLQAWQRLPAHERARLRQAAVRFRQLDAASQAALRARFDALDPQQQRGWLLGPGLGPYYPRLQPLLGFVGESERLPLLHCLYSMSAQELDLLVRLAFSTPPSRRAALRAELVLQPPATRLAWLQARLGH